MLYVWCMASICQIGFSKITHLDHFIPWGNQLPKYPPNFVKYLYRGQIFPPKCNLKPALSGGGILLPVPILTNVILRGHYFVSSYEISRGIAQCTDQLFLYIFLNLQMWTAQWHSAACRSSIVIVWLYHFSVMFQIKARLENEAYLRQHPEIDCLLTTFVR